MLKLGKNELWEVMGRSRNEIVNVVDSVIKRIWTEELK